MILRMQLRKIGFSAKRRMASCIQKFRRWMERVIQNQGDIASRQLEIKYAVRVSVTSVGSPVELLVLI